ncbi:MAG: hypothetical protein J7502_10435 [Flavisolibacter sp.]|nr:hypothetical protein [Flavisolibacter sp.]
MESKILIKAFLWKGLSFLVSIVITIVLAHVFKAGFSAEFQFLIYTCSLFASFFILGLDVSISHFLSRKQISIGWINSILIGIPLMSLFISLPAIYFIWKKGYGTEMPAREVFIFAGLYIAGTILINLSSAILTAIQKNHFVSKVSFFYNLILLMLILSVFFFLPMSIRIQWICRLWFFFVFIQGCYLFVYSKKLSKGRFVKQNPTDVSLSKVIAFSFFVFFINYIFLIAGRIPIFFLHSHESSYVLGNYIYTYKLLEYGATIAAFIYFPVISLAASESDKIEKLILFLARLCNTAVLIIGIIVLLYGQYIFPILLGKSFDMVGEILIYLFPGLIAMCSSNFFTAYFYGKGLLKYNLISSCIMLFFILVLIVPFAKLWDVKGVSIAFSISNLMSFSYDLFIFRKFSKYSFMDVFILSKTDLNRFISRKGK